MNNADLLLLGMNLCGVAFLVSFGWHVFVRKNDPGVIGLTLSAMVSVHIISEIIHYMVP